MVVNLKTFNILCPQFAVYVRQQFTITRQVFGHGNLFFISGAFQVKVVVHRFFEAIGKCHCLLCVGDGCQ